MILLFFFLFPPCLNSRECGLFVSCLAFWIDLSEAWHCDMVGRGMVRCMSMARMAGLIGPSAAGGGGAGLYVE